MRDPTAHGRAHVNHVRDPSDQCVEFTTDGGGFPTASGVIKSQRLLAEGPPGPTYECPPQVLAMLIEPPLESLAKVRATVDETARAYRGHAVLVELRAVFPWDLALARWEDDGGRLDRKHER